MYQGYQVFLNGLLLGVVHNAEKLIKSFRILRRRGEVNEFVSIFHNVQFKSIQVASDGGRVCRPVVIVSNGVSRVQERHIKVPIYLTIAP